jgi:outer membrane protein TolC
MRYRTPGNLAPYVRRPAVAALSLVAVLLLPASVARAQSDDAALSLQAALERALDANPEILAARARVQAAATRPEQAGSLPDPMLTGVFRNVGFSDITIGDEMMAGAGVRFTQPLPYRGKRELRTAVAGAGIEVSAAQLELISRRVVREIATAFFELDYLDQATEIVSDTRDYLIDLEQTAQARYAVGEGIQQDVLKAQVEISALINRLIVLDQQRASIETRLNRMLDQPVATAVDTAATPRPPTWDLELDALITEASAASALVRERARQVRQQEANLELSRRDTKPDWVLGGSWLYRGDLPSVWEVNVGLTLPLYRSDKQERAIDEASAMVTASRLDHRDSTGAVAAAVREHYLHADRAARLVRLYREATIPQSTLSLESAIAGYEVGRVDFLTVIDNVVTLLTYRLEYSRQSTDYLQALVAIEEHLGRSLGTTPPDILRQIRAADDADLQSTAVSGGER